MTILETKIALSEALKLAREHGQSIGFVPTMGALHAGHIALVKRCRTENDTVVVSIFVNPTQFNDKNDLANYPRSIIEDIKLLDAAGCDLLFLPSVEEMYPVKDTRKFDFGGLDAFMEGKSRPGHFNGVWQIVSKLFDVVKPTRAYFGEKDFQQLAIIRYMVKKEGYPVEIVGCPIVRESDGLAMSSRNALLTPVESKHAYIVYKLLKWSQKLLMESPPSKVGVGIASALNIAAMFKLDYFLIVDRETLTPADRYIEGRLQGCIAVYAERVRLIDNIAYI